MICPGCETRLRLGKLWRGAVVVKIVDEWVRNTVLLGGRTDARGCLAGMLRFANPVCLVSPIAVDCASCARIDAAKLKVLTNDGA